MFNFSQKTHFINLYPPRGGVGLTSITKIIFCWILHKVSRFIQETNFCHPHPPHRDGGWGQFTKIRLDRKLHRKSRSAQANICQTPQWGWAVASTLKIMEIRGVSRSAQKITFTNPHGGGESFY